MYAEMAISAVNMALSTNALQAQFQIAAARKGLDAQRFQGEAAIKLIQAASLDPNVGRNLDISV